MPASIELITLIAESCRAHPDKVAFTDGDLSISYARLDRDVDTLALRLIEQGIRPGDAVAIHIARQAAHWVLVVALMRIGAVSVSLTDRYRAEIDELPQLAAVLCPPGQASRYAGPRRIIEVNPDWLEDAPALSGLPPPIEVAGTVGRICFTSGTSGVPKIMLMDAETLWRRLSGTAPRSRITGRTVLWCGLGADTAYGFTATLATWLVGGQIVFATRREDIERAGVNLIIASPAALNGLRRSDALGAASGRNGRITETAIVGGGRLSTTLRDQLLREVCSELFTAYGSSEAGGVTLCDAKDLDRHPGAVGRVFADVEVEIVDPAGAPVQFNSAGQIRIRTKNAVQGYLGDPVASAAHFKDGWFYPGDAAMLSPDGFLTILGRPSNVVNIGGEKLSADEIDSFVCKQAGVADACTVLLPWKDGGMRLAIAVAAPGDSMRSLIGLIRQGMPALPPFSIVPVSAIPRNSMGKVNRAEFGTLLARRLREPGSAQSSDGFVVLPEA